MEILGMSIAIAAVVAGVVGVGARNILGWLKAEAQFNIRHAVASGIIAFIIGVPLIVTAFSAAFNEIESIPEEAQLAIFFLQVASIAGLDALTKAGAKAAGKGMKA